MVIAASPIASTPIASSLNTQQNITITASGGVKVGGIATVTHTIPTFTASGGVAIGGAANAGKSWTQSTSGGVLVGGAASGMRVENFTASGGVTVGGSSKPSLRITKATSGGVDVGGVGAPSLRTTKATSGGVKVGGTASTGTAFGFTATGGVILDGVAVKRFVSAESAGQLLYDSYWDDIGKLLLAHQADTGQFWTATSDWSITASSGSDASGFSYSVANTGQSDFSASIYVTLQSSDNQAGIAFRYLNGSNTWLATLDIRNQGLKVYVLGAGTLSLQGFTLLTIQPNVPYLLEVFAEGSTIIAQCGPYSVKVMSSSLQTATNAGTVVDDSPNAAFNTFDATAPVNNVWTAGGAKVGGTSAFAYIANDTPTGGVKVGGAAGPIYGFNASGGVKVGGTSRQTIVETATGGVTVGGSAGASRKTTNTAVGGVKVGGTSPNTKVNVINPTGGVRIGGSSTLLSSVISQFGNALTVFLSGAGFNRGTQNDPTQSLGGFKSDTEAQRVGFLEALAIPNVDVLSSSHEIGTGSLVTVGADNVSFAASGGATGTKVPLVVGIPQVVSDGLDSSQWVKVERTTSAPMTGFSTIEFVDQFNNVFGMDNTTVAGSDTYRAVIFSNDSVSVCSAISLFVQPLSDPATCLLGLAASGAGRIIGGADAFAAWSYSGFANISTASGTLKEIVYYASRTSDVLNVTIRGCLGTTATMGDRLDVVTQVPPVRVGLEYCQPFNGGAIQTIADEHTAPSAISWTLATMPATGISVGTMQPNDQFGVWIHRGVPAGVVACPQLSCAIGIQFTTNGVVYTDSCQGLFRVSDSSLTRYELAISTTDPPALTPAETFTSLPYTTTTTFDDGTFYLVTNRRNANNMASESTDAFTLVVDSGTQGIEPPSSPVSSAIAATSSGAFSITAVYFPNSDTSAVRADKFRVYVRFDGTNPNVSIDTPITVDASGDNLGVLLLSYTTATKSIPTTAKAIVRTYRSLDGVESTNTNVINATSEATAFVPSTLRGFYRHVAEVVND